MPQVIYLDAVGTIFGVRGSVGEQYAKVAIDFGVKLDEQAINQAFYQSFQSAPRIAFPNLPQAEIPIAEYEWWRSLAEQTFSQTGDFVKFANFDQFFKQLYAYFASAEPWIIYQDTLVALDRWQQQGIALAVLSNFDSRIYSVIEALGIGNYFQSITISTEVGAAKPETLIFETALTKHQLERSPDFAWHIGDSFSEDYEGATAVGINAFWLNRDRRPAKNLAQQTAQTIHLLTDL